LPDQQLEPLVDAAETGDAAARRQLFASLYEELHGIARRELRRNGPALTLGATMLLLEKIEARAPDVAARVREYLLELEQLQEQDFLGGLEQDAQAHQTFDTAVLHLSGTVDAGHPLLLQARQMLSTS
jgi:hypothetical protein